MLKPKYLALVSSALLLTGCGGPDYGMSDSDLAKSLDAFNQYCQSSKESDMQRLWGKNSPYEDYEAKLEAAKKTQVFGNADGLEHVKPLESFDQIGESGHDSVYCLVPKNANYKLPDLSEFGIAFLIDVEKEIFDILPKGMSVRSIDVGGNASNLASISGITFKNDELDSFSQAHLKVRSEAYLPDAYNFDISGEHPFTIRIDSRIESYGGLSNLSEAQVVFTDDYYYKYVDRLDPKSAFCQNYGTKTQAFIDENGTYEGAGKPSEWKPLPSAYICETTSKTPD